MYKINAKDLLIDLLYKIQKRVEFLIFINEECKTKLTKKGDNNEEVENNLIMLFDYVYFQYKTIEKEEEGKIKENEKKLTYVAKFFDVNGEINNDGIMNLIKKAFEEYILLLKNAIKFPNIVINYFDFLNEIQKCFINQFIQQLKENILLQKVHNKGIRNKEVERLDLEEKMNIKLNEISNLNKELQNLNKKIQELNNENKTIKFEYQKMDKKYKEEIKLNESKYNELVKKNEDDYKVSLNMKKNYDQLILKNNEEIEKLKNDVQKFNETLGKMKEDNEQQMKTMKEDYEQKMKTMKEDNEQQMKENNKKMKEDNEQQMKENNKKMKEDYEQKMKTMKEDYEQKMKENNKKMKEEYEQKIEENKKDYEQKIKTINEINQKNEKSLRNYVEASKNFMVFYDRIIKNFMKELDELKGQLNVLEQ